MLRRERDARVTGDAARGRPGHRLVQPDPRDLPGTEDQAFGPGSTTWKLPLGAGDTAYEADAAYYIQSHGRAKEDQPPDLAIEIVVSHPATKALRAGAFLKIPELWVLDIPRHRLTFYHLATRGKHKGTYRPATPEPGVPRPDVRRGPGAARRPRGG